MLKLIISLFAILEVQHAQAEVVSCISSAKANSIHSISASRDHQGYNPEWFNAETVMKNHFFKKVQTSLTPMYISGKFVLKDTWNPLNKADVILDLGTYKGTGSYIANITRFKNKPNEESFKMNCEIKGKVPFENYCINSKYGTPTDALFYAAKSRNVDLIDMLLACNSEANLNVNKKNQNGCTPLMVSSDKLCGTGDFDIFSNFAPLEPVLNSLINAGAYSDLADPITKATPLIKAARLQDDNSAKLLLDMEADINAQDSDNYTPLMWAVESQYVKMVKLLLEFSPDLELKNRNGDTAYEIAKAQGNNEILELLTPIDNEVLIEGQPDGSCTPATIHIKLGARTKLTVKAGKQMLLFKSLKLGIDLMIESGNSQSKNYVFDKVGTFPFSCGVHGGSQQTPRSFMVM